MKATARLDRVGATEVLAVLRPIAATLRDVLGTNTAWGLTGEREGQYEHDVLADEIVLEMLGAAEIAVFSEESGESPPTASGLLAVVDPVDGSTNASRRLPWFATSLCVCDCDGPAVALVANLATGVTYEAIRHGGATRDGRSMAPAPTTELADAIVALSGYPDHHYGWRQLRALGASALDLCAVADGSVDGFVDCVDTAHGGAWDYFGAALVCHESGCPVVDAHGRDLLDLAPGVWRSPVAAATPALLRSLLEHRVENHRPASR